MRLLGAGVQCILALCFASPVAAGPADIRGAHVEQAVAKARRLRLAHTTQWRRLGHWRERHLLSPKSEADGGGFFLAPNGQTSPQDELDATIRGFFGPKSGDEHPRCKFPARYVWLQPILRLRDDLLQQRSCPKFEQFVATMNASSASLVFSSYYLGAPASAFGHTLLRIGKPANNGRRDLLDTGINYSATVDTNNALIYALKGMTGMFRGQFARMPYYYKVREYNDYESRDMWEYELNLSEDELARLVRHLWELGQTHFDYYYLSENCSYHVLAALEAAMPRINLLSHLKYPVLPVDTIKAVARIPTLVKGVSFRPSLRTQFRHRIARLTSAERRAVTTVADRPTARLPNEADSAARILDAAVDLVDLRHAKAIFLDRGSHEASNRQALLVRRAAIEVDSPPLKVPPPTDRPDQSHGSRRIDLGGGASSKLGAFTRLGARLMLHDLADAPVGYPDLAAMEFAPIAARYYPSQRRFEMESASIVRVSHLAPITRFQQKLSWSLDVGGLRIEDESCDRCFAGRVDVGFGAAVATSDRTVAAFAMQMMRLRVSPNFDGPMGAARAGTGAIAGLRIHVGHRITALTFSEIEFYPWQPESWIWKASATVRWQLSHRFAFDGTATILATGTEAFTRLLTYY